MDISDDCSAINCVGQKRDVCEPAAEMKFELWRGRGWRWVFCLSNASEFR